MKKLLCTLICLILAAAALVGCTTPGQTQGNEEIKPGDYVGVHYDADGNLVVPKHEGVTLTLGIPTMSFVLDYEENAYTQWLEEMLGIEIEIKQYASASGQYKQQLATETAGGMELPDVLIGFNLGNDLINQYGEDGYLRDLTDWVNHEERSQLFWDYLEKLRTDPNGDWSLLADKALLMMHSDSRTGTMEGEGAIYGMIDIKTSIVDYQDFYPWINTKWLDVLKLDMPNTLEELKTVLIAFRDRDPNGNGIQDEIPMLGANQKTGDVIDWLMNFFLYVDENYWFNIDDSGELYVPHTTDAYRNAMAYIKDLIDEGLLNPKSLTAQISTSKTLLATADVVGVTFGLTTLAFDGTNREDDFATLDLFGYVHNNLELCQVDMFITDSCEDEKVDAAYDLLMLIYSWDSQVRQRYGVKGEDWDIPADGIMCAMGLPATVKVIDNVWDEPTNRHWNRLVGWTTYDVFDLIDTAADASGARRWEMYAENTSAFNAALKEMVAELGREKICPWLRFNDEEMDMAPSKEGLKKDIQSWRTKFLLGEKDPMNEADWAEYLAALENAGLKAYIDAGNVCYDRMYPNGHVSG